MSRWLKGEPVLVARHDRPRAYRFRDGGAYQFGEGAASFVIEIPADFVFDISAPWWAQPVLKLGGVWRRMLRASGLHDFGRGTPGYSLWLGDLLFADALHTGGVREPWLTVCWWAVRTNDNRT